MIIRRLPNAYLFVRTITVVLFLQCCQWKDSSNQLACQGKDRSAQLELQGQISWFPKRSCDTTFFLQNFHHDFKGVIEWPPEYLCNTCDISVDVTGSSYMQSVEYRGQSMPLAEYNLWKLRQYLLEHDVFNYGEKVTVRLFGDKKGSTGSSGREARNFQIPKLKLDVEGRILTRRYKDLQLDVHKVIEPKLSKNVYVDSTFAWFYRYVKSGNVSSNQYLRSPLIEHVKATISFYPILNNVSRDFIFVTDGWVELDDEIYFWPRFYSENPQMLEEIKDRVIKGDLKPFSEFISGVSIIIIGLNDDGNTEYRKAQQDLFRWYFSPQPVELIPY